jgi:hypothetical protein
MQKASVARPATTGVKQPGARRRIGDAGDAAPVGRLPADSRQMALQEMADRSLPVQAVMQLQRIANAAPAAAARHGAAVGGVVQLAYDDALRRESAHAVETRLRRAIMNRRAADSKEDRWRAAQAEPIGSAANARAPEFQLAMQQHRDAYDRDFQVLRVWYDRSGEDKLTKVGLGQADYDAVAKGNLLFDRLITGAMATYKAEADRQYERGRGQDELLLGYRAEVAREANPAAKILNTNIWSWGVNQAWIEGGASRKAAFTLDTGIGDTALGYLAYMSGKDFLAAIKPENWPRGEANSLWHNRNDRPTWYALELSGLLDMGYRPNDAGTQLVPPQGPTGAITGDVQGTGVGAYIKEEG